MNFLSTPAILLALTVSTLSAEEWEIVTFAGTGQPGFSGDGGPATVAQINQPFGVEVGPDGHLYLCDTGNHVIRKIDRRTGTITTVAGKGGVSGYSGDEKPATEARLFEPYEIRFDQSGHMFFVEMRNNVVRRVDAKTGVTSTVAGVGEQGFSGDGGPAVQALLSRPHSIALDVTGNLFICDIGNQRIRHVDMVTGIISTYCGTGETTGPDDGSAISPNTPLKGPRALTVDSQNNLWLALREGNQIVKFDRDAGVIRHLAGTGSKGFTGNGGPAVRATLSGPKGIVFDESRQQVYLADTESHTLRAIDLSTDPPTLQLIAGTGRQGDGPDGDPLKCRMTRLHGVGLDPETGLVFIGDSGAHRVRVLRPRK
jgi:DNA-binding beta-propeller fold protein YncE